MGSEPWRMLQVFLSPNCNVFEVEINHDTFDLRCTCPGFRARRRCKHTRFVERRMDLENRHYTMNVAAGVSAKVMATAMQSAEGAREFVANYGRIEVL